MLASIETYFGYLDVKTREMADSRQNFSSRRRKQDLPNYYLEHKVKIQKTKRRIKKYH